MKLAIKQNLLMEHLNYVIKGISNKNLIPILNCIKFDLTKDGLYLMSTDNEIAIKTFIDKKNIDSIEELGSFVISGKYIYEIVKKLPNVVINIHEIIESKISIYTKESSFNLNCNNISDFPDLEIEESKFPITITSKEFKNLVNKTAFATSTQESRPVLTGINFKLENGKLEVTSTDSYRLSKITINLKQKIEENYNIIIPTKNLIEMTRLFHSDDMDIEMHIFTNKIIFKFATIEMMSRLINGTYPDVSKLIPEEHSLIIGINLDILYNSIDRASLLTNEADKNTIKLESNKNIIIISSNIPEIGNVEEKINVEKYLENNIKIAFSSKYMLEALKTIDSEKVELLFNGEIKPIIIKDPENSEMIQLILPIRTY
jgi:DNA polymerase III subunit beta